MPCHPCPGPTWLPRKNSTWRVCSSTPPRKPIAWSDYRDDTAEQLRTLIQAKLEGRSLAAPVPEEVPILQLVDALKRSVAQALQQPGDRKQGHSAEANPTADIDPSPSQKKKSSRKSPGRRSA